MHHDPHLRIMRTFEDADDDGECVVPEPEVEDVSDSGGVVFRGKWYCDCGQTNNGEWTDCAWCGRDREDMDG